MNSIWTLDARNSMFLEVLSEYFNLSSADTRSLIVDLHQGIISELNARGLSYESTKQALIPQNGQRKECAFLFDTSKISSFSYGRVVAEAFLPTIERELTCSVLVGDLSHPKQEIAIKTLLDELLLTRSSIPIHTSQLYCVYLNNLSETMMMSIDGALKSFDFYFGYVETTYSTPVKDWLSTILLAIYVKTKDKFISGHEDDAPKGANWNGPNWPLEDLNYQIFSVPASLFDVFMSYKIERRVIKGFESDSTLALNAISGNSSLISGMKVQVEEAKLEYLRSAKAGSLELAGLAQLTSEELGTVLTAKLKNNYLYNLRYLEEHDTSLFNLILDFTDPHTSRPLKLVGAMEYLAERNELRLVTLY